MVAGPAQDVIWWLYTPLFCRLWNGSGTRPIVWMQWKNARHAPGVWNGPDC